MARWQSATPVFAVLGLISLLSAGGPLSAPPGPVLAAPLASPAIEVQASLGGRTAADGGRPGPIVAHRTRDQARSPAAPQSAGNLVYHGGPVQRAGSTSYAIYWQPGGTFMSATYRTLINRDLADVGGSALYGVATQYGDGGGNVVNHSTFGGAWDDSGPYPSDPLTDDDLQQEIRKALAANPAWLAGLNSAYFVFTARGTRSCAPRVGCAFANFCGYHASFLIADNPILYANQPYASGSDHRCNSGHSPNGDLDADGTLSILSHEQLEIVTDPPLSGWYDADSSEIGDQCTWDFGAVDPPSQANVILNGHPYHLQQKWSNTGADCALALEAPPPSPPPPGSGGSRRRGHRR